MNVCENGVSVFFWKIQERAVNTHAGTHWNAHVSQIMTTKKHPLEYKCLMCNLLFNFLKHVQGHKYRIKKWISSEMIMVMIFLFFLILANSCSNFTCAGFLDNMLQTEQMWRLIICWVCVVHHEEKLAGVGYVQMIIIWLCYEKFKTDSHVSCSSQQLRSQKD